MAVSLQGVWQPLAGGIEQMLAVAQYNGLQARITSAVRTYSQQSRLYRRYLAGMNPYPVARPGTSDHERGLAVDVWTGNSADNARLGALWQSWGGRWSPADEVHFTVRHG